MDDWRNWVLLAAQVPVFVFTGFIFAQGDIMASLAMCAASMFAMFSAAFTISEMGR